MYQVESGPAAGGQRGGSGDAAGEKRGGSGGAAEEQRGRSGGAAGEPRPGPPVDISMGLLFTPTRTL